MIAASESIKGCLHRYTKLSTYLSTLDPLEFHFILLNALLGDRWPYISYLNDQVVQQLR